MEPRSVYVSSEEVSGGVDLAAEFRKEDFLKLKTCVDQYTLVLETGTTSANRPYKIEMASHIIKCFNTFLLKYKVLLSSEAFFSLTDFKKQTDRIKKSFYSMASLRSTKWARDVKRINTLIFKNANYRVMLTPAKGAGKLISLGTYYYKDISESVARGSLIVEKVQKAVVAKVTKVNLEKLQETNSIQSTIGMTIGNTEGGNSLGVKTEEEEKIESNLSGNSTHATDGVPTEDDKERKDVNKEESEEDEEANGIKSLFEIFFSENHKKQELLDSILEQENREEEETDDEERKMTLEEAISGLENERDGKTFPIVLDWTAGGVKIVMKECDGNDFVFEAEKTAINFQRSYDFENLTFRARPPTKIVLYAGREGDVIEWIRCIFGSLGGITFRALAICSIAGASRYPMRSTGSALTFVSLCQNLAENKNGKVVTDPFISSQKPMIRQHVIELHKFYRRFIWYSSIFGNGDVPMTNVVDGMTWWSIAPVENVRLGRMGNMIQASGVGNDMEEGKHSFTEDECGIIKSKVMESAGNDIARNVFRILTKRTNQSELHNKIRLLTIVITSAVMIVFATIGAMFGSMKNKGSVLKSVVTSVMLLIPKTFMENPKKALKATESLLKANDVSTVMKMWESEPKVKVSMNDLFKRMESSKVMKYTGSITKEMIPTLTSIGNYFVLAVVKQIGTGSAVYYSGLRGVTNAPQIVKDVYAKLGIGQVMKVIEMIDSEDTKNFNLEKAVKSSSMSFELIGELDEGFLAYTMLSIISLVFGVASVPKFTEEEIEKTMKYSVKLNSGNEKPVKSIMRSVTPNGSVSKTMNFIVKSLRRVAKTDSRKISEILKETHEEFCMSTGAPPEAEYEELCGYFKSNENYVKLEDFFFRYSGFSKEQIGVSKEAYKAITRTKVMDVENIEQFWSVLPFPDMDFEAGKDSATIVTLDMSSSGQ